MSKGQRGNKEAKKPRQDKKVAVVPPVLALPAGKPRAADAGRKR